MCNKKTYFGKWYVHLNSREFVELFFFSDMSILKYRVTTKKRDRQKGDYFVEYGYNQAFFFQKL